MKKQSPHRIRKHINFTLSDVALRHLTREAKRAGLTRSRYLDIMLIKIGKGELAEGSKGNPS